MTFTTSRLDTKSSALLLSLCLAAVAQAAIAVEAPTAPAPKPDNEVRAACAADVQKLCAGVQPGGGRIRACMRQHKEELSDGCKQAIAKARQNPS
ncbi:MAG: cysteine rich repeat-containing protein [Steroidobacteraceae bacterium]